MSFWTLTKVLLWFTILIPNAVTYSIIRKSEFRSSTVSSQKRTKRGLSVFWKFALWFGSLLLWVSDGNGEMYDWMYFIWNTSQVKATFESSLFLGMSTVGREREPDCNRNRLSWRGGEHACSGSWGGSGAGRSQLDLSSYCTTHHTTCNLLPQHG